MEDIELFKGKSFTGLLEDIYNNQVNRQGEIKKLIQDIRVMVRHAGDLEIIGPIITNLMDTAVKNDDHLIKVAVIAQRIMATTAKLNGSDDGSGITLSQEEKQELLKERDKLVKQLEAESDKLETDDISDVEISDIQKKISKVKERKKGN